MKCLNFCLLLFLCVISSNIFAQTPKQIEVDLLKSFKKIDYWFQKANGTMTAPLAANDSLSKANDVFAKKLRYYTEKYPTTISYSFNSLQKAYLDISTSSDNKFRIYSWDTWTGGTMHWFENVMQYKTDAGYRTIIDTPKSEGDVRPAYDKIYTFKTGGKIYYLTRFLFIESSRYSAYGITVFTIENGKVTEAKIIKTHSGMRSGLSYECDFNSIPERNDDKLPEMRFDNTTNIISLPLMNSKNAFSGKFILYKFTGKYFERVKN